MIPNLNELLAQDITDRTGTRTLIAPKTIELLKRIDNGEEPLPLVSITSTGVPFLESPTFEAHSADGTVSQVPYDIDHIPVDVAIIACAIGQTTQETEDIAYSVRSTYAGNTDAGVLMVPIDQNGSFAVSRYSAKQLRTPVAEHPSFSIVIIEPADGFRVPIPYPADDLRASLSDRPAITRLLIAYFYYMCILESDVPGKINNEYSKLFKTKSSLGKGVLGNSKKALFKKLRENEFTASALNKSIAQKITGENINNLVDDFQAGHLSRNDFNTFFSTILPVVPDLYDRAMKNEPVDTTLAMAMTKLAETQKRAETIANSLGIEENPAGEEYYEPRSLGAAEIYIQIIAENEDATMSDAIEAYKYYAEEQAASAQAQQDAMQDTFNNMLKAKLAGKSALGAALGLGLGASAAAGSGRSARKTNKPDLLGSAGCAKSKGTVGGCAACALRQDCARA